MTAKKRILIETEDVKDDCIKRSSLIIRRLTRWNEASYLYPHPFGQINPR